MDLYGGIEAGGTKFNCIIASGPDDIRAEARFPTTSPQETLKSVVDFFQTNRSKDGELAAIGIASFGPVDLHPESTTYGYITTTPKSGWQNADILGFVQKGIGLPVAFDTDVNGAAIGEGKWGAGQGISDFIYLTIGTGIGGGAIVNGKPLHGLLHTEMGHILLPHDLDRDPYTGSCPFHGDCFEGLANGPAIEGRWGKPGYELEKEHEAWDLEAEYIAAALHAYICTLSPKKIILGGGVMEQEHLFPMVRQKVKESLNEYIQTDMIKENIDNYIVPPGLGGRAGELGAVAMAMELA